MRIPESRDLDSVTASEWRVAEIGERQEFLDRWRKRGVISFVCHNCWFPSAWGRSFCEACRPITKEVENVNNR